MKLRPFHHRTLAVCAVIAGFAASASAATPAVATINPFGTVDTSWCTNPLLSQPFLDQGDANQYMLVPGQSPENFDGAGWTLTGGAQIVSATLADGATGSVLDLPSGSRAISPTVCIREDYPDARAMVRGVTGPEGLSFQVSYQGRRSWVSPKATGHLHGKQTDWILSAPVHVKPSQIPGWQPVRFTLVPNGKDGETQVYDFYVDPRMKR